MKIDRNSDTWIMVKVKLEGIIKDESNMLEGHDDIGKVRRSQGMIATARDILSLEKPIDS